MCYIKNLLEIYCVVFNFFEYGLNVVWVYFGLFLDKVMYENKGIDILYFYSDGVIL